MVVADEVHVLFGDPLREPPGVLHVSSVWAEPGVGLRVLRIGPDAPASATDFRVLGVARARCDALVTTGRILREEPEVEQRLPADLARWRRDALGRSDPPTSVVLTARADLDLAHPLLATAARAVVVTGRESAQRLASRIRSAGVADRVEVVGLDAPDLRGAVRFLQQERGLASVCIEAGPSTSLALYDEPLLVDELMLSEYQGDDVVPAARGGSFLSWQALEERFEERSRCRVDEPSGPWCFRRFVRRGAGRARPQGSVSEQTNAPRSFAAGSAELP